MLSRISLPKQDKLKNKKKCTYYMQSTVPLPRVEKISNRLNALLPKGKKIHDDQKKEKKKRARIR